MTGQIREDINLFKQIHREVSSRAIILAVVITILIAGLSIFAWYALSLTEKRHVNNLIKSITDFSAESIETKLKNSFEPAKHLAQAWEDSNGLTLQQWQNQNKYHLTNLHHTLRLSWMSENGKTMWSAPKFIPKKSLIHYAKVAKQDPCCVHIFTYNNKYLLAYLPLIQGLGKKPDGFLITTYPTTEIFNILSAGDLTQHVLIKVMDKSQVVYSSVPKGDTISKEYQHTATINLHNTDWKIIVAPNKKYTQYYISWIPDFGLIIGLIFGILAGSVLILLEFARINAKLITYSARKYKTVINNAVNAIIRIDTKGIIHEVNPAVTKLLGYEEKELLHKSVNMLIPKPYSTKHDGFIQDYLKTGKSKIIGKYREIEAVHKEGRKVPVIISVSKIELSDQIYFIGIMQDMTKTKQAEAELQKLAHHDYLTGLYNRAFFEEYLDKAIALQAREKALIAVMYLDLDDFKEVNDELGHDVGDEVLKYVANEIQQIVRKADLLCRLGGDEYAIVLQNIQENDSLNMVAEKILDIVRQPIKLTKHNIEIGVSIGIAVFPEAGKTKEELMKNADIALYHAKSTGKNHYEYYQQDIEKAQLRSVKLKKALQQSLENNEFNLVYQPIIALKSKKIVGVEVLLRWENEAWPDTSTSQFIPILESIGKISDVGLWVLSQAVKTYIKLASSYELSIAINISPKQLLNEQFFENFNHITTENGVNPKNIQLELTESALSEDINHLITPLNKLRELGCLISIDDFGIGHSSLERLQLLPVDIIKVDKSFVADMVNNSKALTAVETTLEIAKKLSLDVVAEGVETQEQAALLIEKGCRKAQGFLFAKPMPYDELVQYIQSHS